MTTQVTLLRHGETSANKNGLVLGTSNVPLTKIGRLQAKMAARKVAELEIDTLFSSPYYRAKETSKYVQETTNLNPIFMDGLKEMNSGEMEGSDATRMEELYPEYMSKWRKDPTNTRPPGGETLGEVHERSWKALQYIYSSNVNKHILVVSHLFPIQGIICKTLGLDSSQYFKIKLDLGSLSKIIFDKDEAYITSINDTCHLDT
ncbi:MAG: histidine phosphatase family protein [Dehalococcoidia bacterium]